MPSKSAAQARLMAAAAHNAAFAKKAGIPQSVAREYNAADTKRKVPWHAIAAKARKKK